MLESLLGSLLGSPAVAGSTHGALSAQGLGSASSPTSAPLTDIVNGNNPPAKTQTPKAGINWILFDEQFRPVKKGSVYESNYSAVSANGNEVTTHTMTASVAESGYLYVYCSNESNKDVFFDNLQVIDRRGPLVEENSYYPFGLTMTGISSKAAGFLLNRYKFNGGNELQSGEFSDGSGLELYDAKNRMYDAQLGRFGQIDFLADLNQTQSPYIFGSDNPILINDPLGLQDSVPVLKEVTVTTTQKAKPNQAQILPIPLPDKPLMPIPLVPFPTSSKYRDPEADPITGINWWKMIDAGTKKVAKVETRLFLKALLKVLVALKAATTPAIPDAKDLPWTPGQSPGPDWVWKGDGPPESGMGNWVNDKTNQKLHPDLEHPDPKGPHWGLKQPDGSRWNLYPDGTVERNTRDKQ